MILSKQMRSRRPAWCIITPDYFRLRMTPDWKFFFSMGGPGVFSARYAGEGATDEMNNQKLLTEMRGVAPRRRRAQFRSIIALIGNGVEEMTEGICPGVLGEIPRGVNGFGYDPIFIPDGFTRTYAELTAEEKNRISHRARSFMKMKEVLKVRLRATS